MGCLASPTLILATSEPISNPMQAIYSRHRNVVPVMAMGVAELKEELAHNVGIGDLPEIHQVRHSQCSAWMGLSCAAACCRRSRCWRHCSTVQRPADHGRTPSSACLQFLDGFYLSRIGIRILIGQHIALHEDKKPDHIGAQCNAMCTAPSSYGCKLGPSCL